MMKLRRREDVISRYHGVAFSNGISLITRAPLITTCLGRRRTMDGESRSPATIRISIHRVSGRGWHERRRVCGINPGRIIRRRGELKLPYASTRWINSPETFIHFNALLCRNVARNVICTIDCSVVYILVINVATAPMDTHLNPKINVAAAPIRFLPFLLTINLRITLKSIFWKIHHMFYLII